MSRAIRVQHGVSLIEALVALAVVAFGMLGVAGLQASLRFNADVAKQRSEAVRLAQTVIEQGRGFSVLQTTVGKTAFADLQSIGAVTLVVPNTNTTYTRQVTVVDNLAQHRKSVNVDVTWPDRNGDTQSVTLTSQLHRIDPAIAGALFVPTTGSAAQAPRGRHAAIPPGAVPQSGTGTSDFAPTGSSGLTWVFNDTTGFITKICSPACVAFDGYLLSGFVNYVVSTALIPPTPMPADAENPTSSVMLMPAIGVVVDQTAPIAGSVSCFTQAFPTYVAYFCAVPVDATRKWAGRSNITGLTLAADLVDADKTKARVCRYTRVRAHAGVTNAEHPLDYVDVAESLANQNFLVIQAGDGTTAFDCPADDSSTPFINGNTFRHQPAV